MPLSCILKTGNFYANILPLLFFKWQKKKIKKLGTPESMIIEPRDRTLRISEKERIESHKLSALRDV